MDYAKLVKTLFSVNQKRGMQLGLGRMEQLSRQQGYPERTFPSIHIAGTNGKGSVATKIAAAFQASGKRVGLFTSPHIDTFRERIQVNGHMIKEEEVVRLLPPIMASPIGATFFELTTLLAFHYFAEEKVDIAVIETGLGGRYDATNILTPQLSVITSIFLDHTEFLGNRVEEIAREKGGIIKAEIPVVIGPTVPIEVIEPIAREKNSPLIVVSDHFSTFEEENCAIAEAALKQFSIPREAIAEGLRAIPPCRKEMVETPEPVVFDVAHNPSALQRLFSELPKMPLRIVCGFSRGKDLAGCFTVLKQQRAPLHLVAAENVRCHSVEALYHAACEVGIDPTLLIRESSISDAMTHGRNPNSLLVVCGSFFIMGEAKKKIADRISASHV